MKKKETVLRVVTNNTQRYIIDNQGHRIGQIIATTIHL